MLLRLRSDIKVGNFPLITKIHADKTFKISEDQQDQWVKIK